MVLTKSKYLLLIEGNRGVIISAFVSGSTDL